MVFITVHETVVFPHCRRSEGRIIIGELGGAANELEVDGFDDEPDANEGQPGDEPNQPPVEGQPAAVVPPDRDFFSYLDYTIGVWQLKDVEAFIKQNIVYIVKGVCHIM